MHLLRSRRTPWANTAWQHRRLHIAWGAEWKERASRQLERETRRIAGETRQPGPGKETVVVRGRGHNGSCESQFPERQQLEMDELGTESTWSQPHPLTAVVKSAKLNGPGSGSSRCSECGGAPRALLRRIDPRFPKFYVGDRDGGFALAKGSQATCKCRWVQQSAVVCRL